MVVKHLSQYLLRIITLPNSSNTSFDPGCEQIPQSIGWLNPSKVIGLVRTISCTVFCTLSIALYRISRLVPINPTNRECEVVMCEILVRIRSQGP